MAQTKKLSQGITASNKGGIDNFILEKFHKTSVSRYKSCVSVFLSWLL